MDKLLSARQRRPSMAKRKKRRIGAFSRRLSLSDLDLRTNAGKFANSIKEGLEAQIGDPTAGQQILIKLDPRPCPRRSRPYLRRPINRFDLFGAGDFV